MVVTKQGHDLALVPFAAVAPSEGSQFQSFEVTLDVSGSTHDQPFSTSSTTTPKGEESQAPGSSLVVLASVDAQMVEVTPEPLTGEDIQVPEVAPKEVAGTHIQVPKLTLEEMVGPHIQSPELTLKELASAQIQALLIQPVIVVSSTPHIASSSCPPSTGMRDIEGLASLTLADLAATFQMDFLK